MFQLLEHHQEDSVSGSILGLRSSQQKFIPQRSMAVRMGIGSCWLRGLYSLGTLREERLCAPITLHIQGWHLDYKSSWMYPCISEEAFPRTEVTGHKTWRTCEIGMGFPTCSTDVQTSQQWVCAPASTCTPGTCQCRRSKSLPVFVLTSVNDRSQDSLQC